MTDRDKEIWALHEENAVLEDKLIDYRKRNEELIIELNRIQAELTVCNEALDNSMKLNSHLQEENETLRGVVKQNHLIRENNKSPLALLTTEIKSEAYKEFAELIKDEITNAIISNGTAIKERVEKHNVNRYEDNFCVMCDGKVGALVGIEDFIDNLLKELVGEDK